MGAVPALTETTFRALARSSPWRWRALSFDLHRRPLHGPAHAVRATVVRPGRLVVTSPSGTVNDLLQPAGTYGWSGPRGSGTAPLPYAWDTDVDRDADGLVLWRDRWRPVADDPMWQDYQFVAMLDPVELADACRPDDPDWDVGDPYPPALALHRLHTAQRHGRETWWAEVSPVAGYDPRCSCCPLLFGRVSQAVEDGIREASSLPILGGSAGLATRFLVGLDVGTGVCVHVEHLDGDHVGRGFSVDITAVDDAVVLPAGSR